MLSTAEPARPTTGPTERFDELFRGLSARLFGLAYRVVGDQQEAEDIVQEAFLKLTGAPALERPDEEVAAWLRRVCLNLSFNRVRDLQRARARWERVGRLELESSLNDAGGPAGVLLRREEQAGVRRALAGLPERQRDCLLLRHSGYAYAEIAETLGIAIGSVGVLLARAERAFRDIYREHNHDLP